MGACRGTFGRAFWFRLNFNRSAGAPRSVKFRVTQCSGDIQCPVIDCPDIHYPGVHCPDIHCPLSRRSFVRTCNKNCCSHSLLLTFIVRTFIVRSFIVRTFIVRAFIVRAFIVHLSGHLTKIVAPIAHMFSDITKAKQAAFHSSPGYET